MVSIVAAIGKDRELGKDNKLLWNIPGDLKHFKEITNGHPIIMGRKTFESIGRILPNRTNIIITRDSSYNIEGAAVVHSLEEGIEKAKEELSLRGSGLAGDKAIPKRDRHAPIESELAMTKEGEVFIIGGGQIFQQAMSLVDKLYLTIIDQTFDADTFFPDYSMFKKTSESEWQEENGYKYKFAEFEK